MDSPMEESATFTRISRWIFIKPDIHTQCYDVSYKQ